VAPEDGAVTGSRPVFQVGYDGAEGLPFRQLRFRLTLDPHDPDSASRDFDQRKRPRGWLPGEPGRVLFRPGVPLGDGVYRWQVRVWDGVQWVGGDRTFEIRVDTVPPAEVRDL